jgi:hypothetical protein
MKQSASSGEKLDAGTARFYRVTLRALMEAGIPFLVGGAYAFSKYTGVTRDTKDFDLFVRRAHARQALKALQAAGYTTDLTFPHWLGKAFHGDASVDIIYSSGNGAVPVDDAWFERSLPDMILDTPVQLCPPEEMIRSKAFILERERYDGADIAHLLLARGDQLDWRFMIDRFGPYWRVLLSHLVLFPFIYPDDASKVPAWVMQELTGQMGEVSERERGKTKVCGGTLLSRQQYLIDIGAWGYKDARLLHPGGMTRKDIAHWTAAIGKE